MDTQHLPILITLDTTAHFTPSRPQTHRTNWSAYQRAIVELHIGKSFSSPETEPGCVTPQPENPDYVWRGNHTFSGADFLPMGPPTTPAAHAPAQTSAAWEKTNGQPDENWKSFHQLCRRLMKAPAPVCPLLDKIGMRRYVAKDRTEILAEHLEEQFTTHVTLTLNRQLKASHSHPIIVHHEEVERRIREYLSAPIPPLPGYYYVSPAETVRTILRLPKRKAPEPDGISTIAIKQLPRRAMVAMTRLFNRILRTGHFPGCWKTRNCYSEGRQRSSTCVKSTPDYATVPHTQTV
ncbi:RNA-directed DNA polymerase from mobile element jockey [Eumeta japonica]|uniref:RNA-directed DNA polymerase from mobile element jockey n=1 Tax=Eumeta variegata TaxID=151549 RepID=A0A4C1VTD9_EUMVA|nr:RNA-directed DNA polymerase from mobile element jockey [Eumeta japonica]